MSETILIPRGTADALPWDIHVWRKVESQARLIFQNHNYCEIRTPIFEQTDLFARSMGQTSDVVQKQMLNLASQQLNENGQIELSGLSLRPEGTASIVRSYIENRMDKKEILSKLFYIGPMFRGERPQKGRLRQFHQIGAEAIGANSHSPFIDAEMIGMAIKILNSLGLKNSKLKINTLGSVQDKENFSTSLRLKLKPFILELCPDCQSRFDRNVFRILDCKNKTCKEVLTRINFDRSYLSDESAKYYESVKKSLIDLGISFEEDINLVRGLDYYTHTVFEITNASLGSQDALGAGGRYSGLVSQLGGPEVDAIGFALGMERIILAMNTLDQSIAPQSLDFFFVAFDQNTFVKSFQLMNVLRDQGLSCDMDFRIGSVKSQMKQADKNGSKYVVLIGENELQKEEVSVKRMSDGYQIVMSMEDFKSSDKRKILN